MFNANDKRVAIIAPEVLPVPPVKGGGIEVCVWETVSNFQKYQAQVFSGIFKEDLSTISEYEVHKGHGFYKIVRDDFQSDIIRLTNLQFNNYFPYVYRVAKTLNQSRPAIIHIHSRCWYLPYLKRLLKYQPKVILHHHNHYFAEMADQEVIRLLNLVDVFCGVSDYTVNIEVLNRFPEFKAKCQKIYNGIDPLKFKPAWDYKSADLQQKKQQLGVPLDSKIIIFVGRVVEGKGVAELVQALAEILPVNPLWRLVIVGSSWFGETKQDGYLEKLKKLSEPIKEMVVFTGYINNDDLPPIYACADIAVAPSIMDEPFGIVLLEAMASGLPVLSSRRGGIPEVVAEDETAVLIDDPENYTELGDKLSMLMKSPQHCNSLGRAGRVRVEKLFSWQKTAMTTEALYDRINTIDSEAWANIDYPADEVESDLKNIS